MARMVPNRFVWNQAALNRTFRSRYGPVGLEMNRRASIVYLYAYRHAGVSKPDPLGRPGRAPGTLRRSLRTVPGIGPSGDIRILVGSSDPVARLHDLGTRPHVIRPRTADGRLVFFWQKTGKVMVLRSVNHPGTPATRFLRDAIRLAGG